MKKILSSAMLGVLLFSCTKSDVHSVLQSENPSAANGSSTGRVGDGEECVASSVTVNLMAGQTMNAGNVTVTNDGSLLYVTYTTTGWTLSEIHLYVGEYENAPQNNSGNPVPGRFPIKQTFAAGTTTYTYTCALSSLPDCFIVAAHAVVKSNPGVTGGTQTGWGQGTQFTGNNWGMYFDYCKMDCPPL